MKFFVVSLMISTVLGNNIRRNLCCDDPTPLVVVVYQKETPAESKLSAYGTQEVGAVVKVTCSTNRDAQPNFNVYFDDGGDVIPVQEEDIQLVCNSDGKWETMIEEDDGTVKSGTVSVAGSIECFGDSDNDDEEPI